VALTRIYWLDIPPERVRWSGREWYRVMQLQ